MVLHLTPCSGLVYRDNSLGASFSTCNVCLPFNCHWFVCLCVGLWKGLGPRIIMIGTLTALQWFIYDSVKVFFRLPRPPPPEEPESLKQKRLQKQQQAA